ncbi:hypothetical protein GGI04_006222, partial [Coemansia thaxteri]
MRSLIRTAEKRARSIILSSVEAIADSMASKLVVDPQCGTKETVHKTIMDIIRRRQATAAHASGQVPDGLSVFDSAIEVAASAASESVLAKIASAAQCLPEDLAYCKTIESLGSSDLRDSMELTSIERASSAIKEWTDGSFEYWREFGDEPFQSDGEDDETFNNNDLFYTEHMLDTIDTFPTDGKKFFDMMERLAEFRMRREDALMDEADEAEAGNDHAAREGGGATTHEWDRKPRRQPRSQRRCPDCQGEIGDAEESQAYSDSEYHVERYAGTKRPRSESRAGDQAFAAETASMDGGDVEDDDGGDDDDDDYVDESD